MVAYEHFMILTFHITFKFAFMYHGSNSLYWQPDEHRMFKF